MSEVYSKRQISEVAGASDPQTKRAETIPSESKKTSKPGRKPLETEPKNKRTAQNRAAQRAFRERKERKMKELEEKIEVLENEKKSAHTESEFLRMQVQTLMAELAKHRGTNDISDLNLPTLDKSALLTATGSSSSPSSTGVSNTFSPPDSEATLKSLSSIVNGDAANTEKAQFAFEFPWSRKGSVQLNTSTVHSGSSSTVPGLASDESTTSSSESSPFELYNSEDTSELPMFNTGKKDKSNYQEFKFDEQFDESVSDFCNDLSTACGTREAPVPKSKSAAATPIEPSATLQLDQIKRTDDPLAFLREPSLDYGLGSFDPSLAFASENLDNLFDDERQADTLATLTTEESIYDPFGMFQQQRRASLQHTETHSSIPLDAMLGTYSDRVTTTTAVASNDNDSDAEVVPSTEGRLLKCTEIWDRITSHPKYADIDIDGLCSELRSKAKCSDKGVVIDYSDVNKVILKSLPKN